MTPFESRAERRIRYAQYVAPGLVFLIAVGLAVAAIWGINLPDPSEVGR